MNRRTVAGVCLIAAPLAHLASCFFWPAGSEGRPPSRSPPLPRTPARSPRPPWRMPSAGCCCCRRSSCCGRRSAAAGATLVSIGVWGTVLGVFGYVSGAVLTLVTVDLGRSAAGAAVYEAIKHDGTVTAVVVLPILLGLLSLVLLLAGVARAGLGGWWLPVAGAVSVVADQLTAEVENPFVLAAGFLPMAVALGYLGRQLLLGAAPATARVPAPASAVAA